jgi:serine protease Do
VVNFADGSRKNAELVGVDTKTDLAVLKIDPQGRALEEVRFGNSDSMRIGDWVMAIGNPFGFGGSVTVGIVSARNRQIGSGPYDDYIQTDAAINRGNSGGPLFNMAGDVIGINTAIISPTGGSIGIGFAIPSNLALGVVAQLRDYGETRRGWLGVRIQQVTDEIAESLGLSQATGVLVSGIEKDGPADNGLLQAGDIIVGFEGTPIHDDRQLRRAVAEAGVDKEVDIEILRKGERQTVRLTLGRLEEEAATPVSESETEVPAEPPAASVKALGMTGSELRRRGTGSATRRCDRRDRPSVGLDPPGRPEPDRGAEEAGAQECASDARLEDGRTALRHTAHELIERAGHGPTGSCCSAGFRRPVPAPLLAVRMGVIPQIPRGGSPGRIEGR